MKIFYFAIFFYVIEIIFSNLINKCCRFFRIDKIFILNKNAINIKNAFKIQRFELKKSYIEFRSKRMYNVKFKALLKFEIHRNRNSFFFEKISQITKYYRSNFQCFTVELKNSTRSKFCIASIKKKQSFLDWTWLD